MSGAPQRPDLSPSVVAFFEERGFGPSFVVPTLDAIGGDAPADVLRWLEAFHVWRFEREEWAKRQPLDDAMESAAWRMFGGEWLPWGAYVSTRDDDGGRFVVYLRGEVLSRIQAGASEDDLRALAGAIYEWHACGNAIDARLVRSLRK